LNLRGSTQDETIGAGEVVTAIVRKEGETVKPADTRCQATVKNGRCKNEITIDTQSGDWLIWCEEHAAVEEKARSEGGVRVVRFVGVS